MHFFNTGKNFFRYEARRGHFFAPLSAFQRVVYISVRAARVRAYTRTFRRRYLGAASALPRREGAKKFTNVTSSNKKGGLFLPPNC